MQKKFVLNLVLIIFVNLLIKPIYIFGIERNVQNIVGAADYGLFYSLFNLSFIFSVILDPGITNYNNRHIAQNQDQLSRSFSSMFSAKILLTFIYTLLTCVYAIASDFNAFEWQMLGMLILGQIFNSFTLYHRSNLAGMHLFKFDTFISIFDKLMMILICAPIIYFNSSTIELNIYSFIYIQTASLFSSALISFIIIKSHTHHFKISIQWKSFINIIKESYPYAVLALLMLLYTKSDTVLLKELHNNGNEEVGIYAAAYRLIDALNMIAVLFAGLLYPLFSKMIKDNLLVDSLVKISFSLLVIPSIIFAVFSYFYANHIIELLYTHNIDQASSIFKVLIITYVFICNGYVFGTLLTANGNIRLLNKIATITVALNIVLNILLIPMYGAIGSAFASLFSFALVSSVQCFYSFKKFNIRLSVNYIWRGLLGICMICMIAFFSSTLNYNWLYAYGIGIFISILILSFLRLLPIKQLFLLIKQDKIV